VYAERQMTDPALRPRHSFAITSHDLQSAFRHVTRPKVGMRASRAGFWRLCRNRCARIASACLIAVVIVLVEATAATAAASIDLRPIATGLRRPTTIAHAGDGSGRLFIALQGGQIVIHDGIRLLPTPFLDISTLISCCGERGLLGLAFHPHYASNGLFYVNYTNTDGDVVIVSYAVSSDPNRAQTSGTILLTIPH
jgi:Glucose / Sorbosone dehydrogenase